MLIVTAVVRSSYKVGGSRIQFRFPEPLARSRHQQTRVRHQPEFAHAVPQQAKNFGDDKLVPNCGSATPTWCTDRVLLEFRRTRRSLPGESLSIVGEAAWRRRGDHARCPAWVEQDQPTAISPPSLSPPCVRKGGTWPFAGVSGRGAAADDCEEAIRLLRPHPSGGSLRPVSSLHLRASPPPFPPLPRRRQRPQLDGFQSRALRPGAAAAQLPLHATEWRAAEAAEAWFRPGWRG